MNPLDSAVEPCRLDTLICFSDIVSFTAFARATADPVELFRLLSGLASMEAAELGGSSGRIVKFYGDSSLILFPGSDADEGVRLLLRLKGAMERHLEEHGAKCSVRFQLHVGDVAVGRFGDTGAIDVIGDEVNTTARLGRREDRFVISPQLFRRLKPPTRKLFHKFTPPIVYVAES